LACWHIESVNYPHTDEYFDNWVDSKGVGRFHADRCAEQWLPAYFITHAMLVVEKMRERYYLIGIGNSATNWEVVFLAKGITPYRADNESLPRAICLASLTAIDTTTNTTVEQG
jgi:hypothetical protein